MDLDAVIEWVLTALSFANDMCDGNKSSDFLYLATIQYEYGSSSLLKMMMVFIQIFEDD